MIYHPHVYVHTCFISVHSESAVLAPYSIGLISPLENTKTMMILNSRAFHYYFAPRNFEKRLTTSVNLFHLTPDKKVWNFKSKLAPITKVYITK